MESKIRVLSEHTINQIAAGEVIENPASVVKELVENAIDAQAKKICIETQGGGLLSIKVRDDGHGMSHDDALLCLERHATSKIIQADDLFDIMTMGFRGEALASIAAISKLKLLTAQENEAAVDVRIEGGNIVSVEPGARARGTTIEVHSLFYNVPARKKFQKSATACSAEVTKVLTQLALAHPHLGIELTQQNRMILSLAPSATLHARTIELLGEDFRNSTTLLEFKEGKYEAIGVMGTPTFIRHNRSAQYLFINNRPVNCMPISFAVRDAYGTRVPTDCHPVYVLHLTLPPDEIDVNVHPQKKEIRLREEGFIKAKLHAAIQRSLLPEQAIGFSEPAIEVHMPANWNTPFSFAQETPMRFREEESRQVEEPLFMHFQTIGLYSHFLLIDAKTAPEVLRKPQGGVLWVDLLAAQSLIIYEEMMSKDHIERQSLLLALPFTFSTSESALLKAHLGEIVKLGIEMRPIGDQGFLVEAIPHFMDEDEVAHLLETLLAEMQEMVREKTPRELRLRKFAASVSCGVRRRKKPFALNEAEALFRELIKQERPAFCPKGKLILFHMREDEIQSRFR